MRGKAARSMAAVMNAAAKSAPGAPARVPSASSAAPRLLSGVG